MMNDEAQRADHLRFVGTWVVLLVGLILAVAASMFVGHGDLGDATLRETFIELRTWRTLAGFFVGACLSVAGVAVQAIFQNPLASPSIIGTTAGASLGGQLALLFYPMLLGTSLATLFGPELLVPIGCLIGALAALAILLVLTGGRQALLITLLTGFLLTSFFVSIGAFVVSLAQNTWELGRAVLAFTLGGITGSGPPQVVIAVVVALAATAAVMTWHRELDLLLTGDDEARTMGLDVGQVRRWGIVWAAVLSAGAVSVGGNIAFVGLVIPHALRPLVGVTTARLAPASFVAGGVFVVLCDVVTRFGPVSTEIPLGVITGLIGAPVFLFVLLRTWREEGAYVG